MKVYVIDSSIVVTALVGQNEKIVALCKSLLRQGKTDKIKLCAPHLLLYEVCNSFRFAYRDRELAQEALNRFFQLPIEWFTFDSHHTEQTLRLAYLFNTTIYDSSYHMLAAFLKGIFYTCDREYYIKAKSLGNIELIQ